MKGKYVIYGLVLFGLVIALNYMANANNIQTIEVGGLFATNAKAIATCEKFYTGEGSWKVVGSTAPGKFEFYVYWYDGPAGYPDVTHNLGVFTIDDIQTISYYTNKPLPTDGTNPYNFYLVIYTLPDGFDDYGWYGYSLTADPYLSENLSAPANTWVKWSTDDGANKLTFYDWWKSGTYGFYGEPTLQRIQEGIINWWQNYSHGVNQDIDYGLETVMAISFQTGSGWYQFFDGYIDKITITLKNGTSLTIDLENKVWVDDDYDSSTFGFGYDHFNSIQQGVNAVGEGGKVIVNSGTYTEQVLVTKNLSLVGAGRDTTIIQCPNSLIAIPGNLKPVVGIYSPGDSSVTVTATISGFTIDGLYKGFSGYFIGVAFRTANGSISNCKIKGVRADPLSGAQGHLAILVNHPWDTLIYQEVNILNNIVEDYGKNGITMNELGTHGLIQENTIIGAGPTGVIAQNGIQVGYGAYATIKLNEIYGNNYTGAGWSAAGILVVGNTLSSNPPMPGTIIEENYVHDNEVGIDFYRDDVYGYGDAKGEAHYNNIVGNEIGLENEGTTVIIDATYNWWGDASGPYHPTLNPDGQGDEVSDNVDFHPWWETPTGSIAPTTTKEIGTPIYGDYLTSSTQITLIATDGESGVKATYYRIWYDGAWTDWITYTGPFTLTGECLHYLEYYSEDKAGTIEDVHNQTHYVDNTPPTTTKTYGTPYYTDGVDEWITSSTLITLT
ncbi:MAG: hypothetical protein QXW78_05315, partial [Candidatus Thermoplasmatota archaeon]